MAVKCQASSLLGRLDLVALQLLPGDSRQKRAQAQATREGWQDGQCISAQVILQHIQTDWSENQIFEGSNMLKYYGCSASHLLSPSFPQRSFPQPVLPPPCSTPRIWEHIMILVAPLSLYPCIMSCFDLFWWFYGGKINGDVNRPSTTDRQGEYRAICLGRWMEWQSFAILPNWTMMLLLGKVSKNTILIVRKHRMS